MTDQRPSNQPKVHKMTNTQLKLKEAWEELLSKTNHTARYGDHVIHSGYFNPESGHGEGPYTGEGYAAAQELEEWEEFTKDPIAMFDWDCLLVMPELAQQAFETWLELHLETMVQFKKERGFVQVALVEAFVRDFYQCSTGHDFEVVQI
jgi:hypothetical protein